MLSLLEAYFAVSGWKHFFLDGGCCWFASTLQKGIRDSVIMMEISFMKKNYIPHFNTEELEEYLAGITE